MVQVHGPQLNRTNVTGEWSASWIENGLRADQVACYKSGLDATACTRDNTDTYRTVWLCEVASAVEFYPGGEGTKERLTTGPQTLSCQKFLKSGSGHLLMQFGVSAYSRPGRFSL